MSRAARALFMTICLVGGLLATAAPALAATISVDAGAADIDPGNDDGDCSLREAVEAANTDSAVDSCPAGTAGLDTITVPSGDVVVEDVAITITDNLVIQGTGPLLAGIDMSAAGDSGFNIDPSATVTFEGLTLRDNPVASAIVNLGDLTLDTVTIAGNDSTDFGGAVVNLGTLAIRDSSFEGNSATDEGGALYIDGGIDPITVTIEDSTFSLNESLDSAGGAIYATTTDLTISGTDFTSNTAELEGGALFADCSCGGGSLLIEESTFDLNSAEVGGAAAVFGPGMITGTTFINNSATSAGGALLAQDVGDPFEFLEIQESLFDSNSAPGGGAIVAGFAQLYVTDSTLRQNHSTGSDPDEGGGAVAIFLSVAILERTTVSDNDAVLVGGGIQAIQAQVAIVNSTISGNSVSDGSGQGGGIHFTDVFSRFVYSTITVNSAPDEGGGVWIDGLSDLISDGSIIAGNPAGGDCNLPLDEDDPNLDSDGSCFPASGVGSITDNPLLSPLANNGGPTDTHALMPGSPALDSADGPSCGELGGVDQRGENRPSGGACDLGAYERQVAPPPPPRHTLTVTNAGGGTVTSEDLDIDCGTECTADHFRGTTGVLVATPDAGSEFDGWAGDCASINQNECTVELDGDREVTATFSPVEIPVVARGRCQGMEHGSTEIRDGIRLIAGTPGDDVLNGSKKPDIICALGGNDVLKGKSQDDILLGGLGDDKLVGGKGNDQLNGGSGTDSCLGGKGKNKLIACE